jgi:hypothetical protein
MGVRPAGCRGSSGSGSCLVPLLPPRCLRLTHWRELRASLASSYPPAGAGPAPLAAIKWFVKEMQVSACGQAGGCSWRGGVCACVCQPEGEPPRASECGSRQGCSPPLLRAPPRPRSGARGAAPRPDSLASSRASRWQLHGRLRPPHPTPSHPLPAPGSAPPPQPPPLVRL